MFAGKIEKIWKKIDSVMLAENVLKLYGKIKSNYENQQGKDYIRLLDKGMFKNVTVNFTGCTASFHIYAVITKRKKRVVQGIETEQSYNKQIGKKYSEILLKPSIWYGPEKIYTDDEK